MPHCAFLSMSDLAGYVCDDTLAVPALEAAGWTVDTVPWRAGDVAWESYDAVVVRSTWDYQDHPEAFLEALDRIEASGTRLMNPLPIVRWNASKRYLADLADQGIPIVPSYWGAGLNDADLATLFEQFNTAELVIKPLVSANAKDTFRLRPGTSAGAAAAVARFGEDVYLAQPFLPAIVDEGEYSLFYFDGVFSHAILKTPAPADFRVQEEHGGRIVPILPEARMREQSEHILHTLGKRLLYARIDLVRTSPSDLALMELELIEPSLYFRMDAGAPARFAAALNRMLHA